MISATQAKQHEHTAIKTSGSTILKHHAAKGSAAIFYANATASYILKHSPNPLAKLKYLKHYDIERHKIEHRVANTEGRAGITLDSQQKYC